MNKTTMNLHFVKRKQQVLTIFLASFWECPDLISESLSCLFNLSIKNKIFANEWKSPKVTPLYKNEGKRSDMTNYSLISIIPVAGKKLTRTWIGMMISKKVASGIIAITHVRNFVPCDYFIVLLYMYSLTWITVLVQFGEIVIRASPRSCRK